MSSVDTEGSSWLGNEIKNNSSYVYTDIHKAFIYAEVLDENRCRMKMIINADPHVDFIPQKLINWCLKNVIGVFLKYIASKAKNLPEEYKSLIE